MAGFPGLDDGSPDGPGEDAVSVPAAAGGVFEMIVYVVAFFALAAIVFLPYIIKQKIKRKQICNQAKTEPFIVSEYYDRMEKAALDILEN